MSQVPAPRSVPLIVSGQPSLGRQIARLLVEAGHEDADHLPLGEVRRAMEERQTLALVLAVADAADGGYALLSALRSDAALPRRDFVALVVGAGQCAGFAQPAFGAGADEFLTAPVTATRITAAIGVSLRQRRAYITLASGYFGPDRRRKIRHWLKTDRRSAVTTRVDVAPVAEEDTRLDA